MNRLLEAGRVRGVQTTARRLTAVLVLCLSTTSPHALARETSATAKATQASPESEIIDPEEVVDSDSTLKEHLTNEAASPDELCVLMRRKQRYMLGLPLRVEDIWEGCHGPDRLRLEDKRFFSLVGREDLWKSQRGRKWVFFALDAGAVACVIGGVTMAVYGFANQDDPGARTWVGAGFATAIGGPSLLSIVRFAVPLQTTKPADAEQLAFSYNQAHVETTGLPRPDGATGVGFAMSLADLRF